MAFRTSRLLRFGDCDPSGIAYFPSYLNMLVGVLEDFFASFGVPWNALYAERRIGTPTVRLDLTFVHPGRHGDMLDFELSVRQVGRSSLELEHHIFSAETLLWTASHTVVATSLDDHKSRPWPDDIRAALQAYLEN
jgi:4-hydroxybenzoyl-CoA thioesterase